MYFFYCKIWKCFGRSGSVVHSFLNQISNNKDLTVTSSKMTRFNISIEEATLFVMKCLNNMIGGEIFIPKLQSYKITDLIKALEKNKFKIIGVQYGEKIHEELITSQEKIRTFEKRLLCDKAILENKSLRNQKI